MRKDVAANKCSGSATRSAVGVRLDFGLRWWSFERLAAEARRFACLLRDCGVAPGDRVVFVGRERPEWVACLVGAMLQRVIVVPLDENSTRDFVLRVCAQASPCLVVHDAEIDASFLPVAARRSATVAACIRISKRMMPLSHRSLERHGGNRLYIGHDAEARGVVLTYGKSARANRAVPFMARLPLRLNPSTHGGGSAVEPCARA